MTNTATISILTSSSSPTGKTTAVIGSGAFAVRTARQRANGDVTRGSSPARIASTLIRRNATPLLTRGFANGDFAIVSLVTGAGAIALVRCHAFSVVEARRIAFHFVAIRTTPPGAAILDVNLFHNLPRHRCLREHIYDAFRRIETIRANQNVFRLIRFGEPVSFLRSRYGDFHVQVGVVHQTTIHQILSDIFPRFLRYVDRSILFRRTFVRLGIDDRRFSTRNAFIIRREI